LESLAEDGFTHDSSLEVVDDPEIGLEEERRMIPSRLRAAAIVVGCVVSLGCATVHQPPGLDSEKMTEFVPSMDSGDGSGSVSPRLRFQLSIEEAVDAIIQACYELEIPLYHPLINRERREAWIASGPFVAQCGRDCDCAAASLFAWGHGAEIASGTISLRIFVTSPEAAEQIRIEISSMFSRTQSTGGEYGSTSNLYFDSLGRVENAILDSLGAAERRKSQL
jgi:hypothetical protein